MTTNLTTGDYYYYIGNAKAKKATHKNVMQTKTDIAGTSNYKIAISSYNNDLFVLFIIDFVFYKY